MPRLALVVDDSMLIRHTIARFLEKRGYNVECASDGQEALRVLARVVPAVIITDLQMPRMDGRELISVLQSKPETAHIPILVLAARRTSTDPQMETRARFVIHKDIDIEQQLENALTSLG